MIPDRLTATLILLAILAAMLVLAVPVIWLVRWLGRGGKHLDGLGPIEHAGEASERLMPPGCQRCGVPLEQALGLPCSCTTDCGKTQCLEWVRSEVTA